MPRRQSKRGKACTWLPSIDMGIIHTPVVEVADEDGVGRFHARSSEEAVDTGVSWSTAAYSISRVPTAACTTLLDALTPGMLGKLGLQLGSRSVQWRGWHANVSVEIMISRTCTHAGAHCDSTPSLLVPIVGTHTVWVAPRDSFAQEGTDLNEQYLSPCNDPAEGRMLQGWEKLIVKPGSIVSLPCFSWRSVVAPANSIALSITVLTGSSGGSSDHMAMGIVHHVAPTRPLLARWSSAASLIRLFMHCYEFELRT